MPKENRRAINSAIDHMNKLQTEWIRVENLTNEKFYVVGHELQELRRIQEQMAAIQSQNARQMTAQFEIFQQSINLMRNCDQELFIREELNHNVAVLNSILSCLYSTLKIFRSSLYTFRTNLFTAFAPIVYGFLPLSVIPKSTLHSILQEVVLNENEQGSRLNLAIPMTSFMTYYETKLLRQVVSSDFGLIFTMAIPFSSQATVLKVYHAVQVPMPDPNTPKASVWDIETDFLAVTLTGHESALLTAHDLNQCIGSTAYSICYSGFAMEKSKDSCLSTLFFKDSLAALQSCTVNYIHLPMREKAKNVGDGNWLITSATHNYLLTQTDQNQTTREVTTTRKKGCRVCIVTLPCGSELQGPNIHLRSDLATCASKSPQVIDVQLPAPLSYLFSKLPPLNDLPRVISEETAKVELLEQVQVELAQLPDFKRRDLEELDNIAAPIISRMATFHPQLSSRLDATVGWRTYLTCALVSLIFSFAIHFLISYLLSKYQKIHRRFPFRLTHFGREINFPGNSSYS